MKTKFNFNSTLIENADRNQILDAIFKLKNINENDNILIYYSGHGVLDTASETAYWQPVDAEMNRPASWINEYQLKSELKAIKAKHVMIVADSCFSGALLRGSDINDFKKLSKN